MLETFDSPERDVGQSVGSAWPPEIPQALQISSGGQWSDSTFTLRARSLENYLANQPSRITLAGIDATSPSDVAAARLALLRLNIPQGLWSEVSDCASARVAPFGDVWKLDSDCAATNGTHFSAKDAYVVSSSGTTGSKKRAVVSTEALRSVFQGIASELQAIIPEGSLWTSFHPPDFGFSYFELLGASVFGGTLAFLAGNGPQRYEAFAVASGRFARSTVLSATPSEVQLMLPTWLNGTHPPPAVIVLSGEPVARADLRSFFRLPTAHNTTIINTYALMEAGGQVALGLVTPENLVDYEAGLAGRGFTGAALEITSKEPNRNELLIGEPLSTGRYLGGDRTRFLVHAGQRWLSTGDNAELRDGNLWITGRCADSQKIGGRWIDLSEAERSVCRVNGVQEVCALPVSLDDVAKDDLLGLLIVLRPDASARTQVRAQIADSLDFKGTITVTFTDCIPLHPNGKRDLKTANDLIIKYQTESPSTRLTAVESVWAGLLGEGIGLDTNVFNCGLDSLGLVHAANHLSRRLEKQVLASFFIEYPLIRDQILALEERPIEVPVRLRRRIHHQIRIGSSQSCEET